MGQPVPEPDRAQAFARPVERVRAPANSSGKATFSSAVMVGIRWKDWKTMPIVSRRNRASASSDIRVRSWPATTICPAVARSNPASSISRLVLPDPDGPTIPTASPVPIARSTPRNTLTGPEAAGRVSRTSRARTSDAGLIVATAGVSCAASASVIGSRRGRWRSRSRRGWRSPLA